MGWGIGLVLGALLGLAIGRVGRLSGPRILLVAILAALTSGMILHLPTWFFLHPPATPEAQGVTRILQQVINLQWLFWWVIGGSLVPLCLTFILGLTRSLSPVVIGLCAGLGVGLLALSWMSYSPVPEFSGSLWRTGLGLQGMLCILCALATAGVQRIRSEEPAHSS